VQLLSLYSYSQVNQREQALQNDLGLLPAELADAARFLILGEYLPLGQATRLLGGDVVEVCLEKSLFRARNGGAYVGRLQTRYPFRHGHIL
jgi:hypothetical protein